MQFVFIGVFLTEATRYPELLAKYVNDGFMRSTAGLAVEAGIYDEAQIRSIFPDTRDVIPAYNFLVEKGLMTPPFKEYNNVGKSLGSVFSVLPAGSCAGSTDLIYRIGVEGNKQELFAGGWGYYPAAKESFKRVLAVTPQGTIVGIGISGIRRPDIAAAHPEVSTAYTGWRLYAVSELGANPLLVYGIVPGTNSVCLLAGRPQHSGGFFRPGIATALFDIESACRLF